MKNGKNKGKSALLVAMMLLFSFASCNTNEENKGQDESQGMEAAGEGKLSIKDKRIERHSDEVGEISALLSDYLEIKNALFEDNFEKAKATAADMLQSLGEMKDEGLPSQVEPYVRKLAEAGDLAGQRQHFATLSRQLYSIAKNRDISTEVLYWQHCPMAMDGEGARWLSNEKQIKNPYMGQQMPSCGSVAETIN